VCFSTTILIPVTTTTDADKGMAMKLNNPFNSLAITTRIGILGALAALATIVLSGIYFVGDQRINAATEIVDQQARYVTVVNHIKSNALLMRLHEKDFFLRPDAKTVKQFLNASLEVDAFLKQAAKLAQDADQKEYIQNLTTGIANGKKLFQKLATEMLADGSTVDANVGVSQLNGLYDDLQLDFDMLFAAADNSIAAARTERIAARTTTQRTTLIAIIVVLISAITLFLLIAIGLARQIKRSIAAMQVLADGRYDLDIDDQDGKNEVGQIARTLQVFKERGLEREQLQAQNEREQAANTARQARVDQLIDAFRSRTRDVLEIAEANMGEMQQTAVSLGEIAQKSAKRAGETAASSNEASVNVQTVAAAAEELAASIGEIAGRVTETRAIVDQATNAARQSNEKVASLDTAAEKIGAVISLIQEIAEQTNLLALNATIEAARAGDAGRGFAVVASEVKALAEETAKATDEIGQHVTAIQTSTKDAVDSINSIATTMEGVNEYTTAIAAAIEEQGATTEEISRNVQDAADGTKHVAENMSDMSHAAEDTNRSAEDAQKSSASAAAQTEELRDAIDKFLNEVAAA